MAGPTPKDINEQQEILHMIRRRVREGGGAKKPIPLWPRKGRRDEEASR